MRERGSSKGREVKLKRAGGVCLSVPSRDLQHALCFDNKQNNEATRVCYDDGTQCAYTDATLSDIEVAGGCAKAEKKRNELAMSD